MNIVFYRKFNTSDKSKSQPQIHFIKGFKGFIHKEANDRDMYLNIQFLHLLFFPIYKFPEYWLVYHCVTMIQLFM